MTWRTEVDLVNGRYRRIYDEAGTSIARVYDPTDAAPIARALELRDMVGRFAVHGAVDRGEALRLYREAGGTFK